MDSKKVTTNVENRNKDKLSGIGYMSNNFDEKG
jgi:hypothetical protein